MSPHDKKDARRVTAASKTPGLATGVVEGARRWCGRSTWGGRE